MSVWHVDGAGAKLDLLGRRGEPGDEGDAGGNVFGPVGDVLSDISLGESQFVCQQEGFAVFVQGYPPVLVDGMDRHREEPEFHGLLLPKGRLLVWQKRASFVT